jgi:predicted nucleic acid-binding Zn ribbon protein
MLMARRVRRGALETDPAPISAVLKAVAEDRGWENHLALGKLGENWEEVVGPQIAGRSRPIKLEHGRLTIRVEPGAWAAELALMGHSLATAAVRFLGGDLVKEVAIVTGVPRSG